MSTDTVSADARSPTASAQPDFTFAVHDPLAAVPLRLHVNGADHHVSVEPWTTLLDALRERVGLTGTKKGCDHGACGACTVMIDGRRVLSCLTLALSARNGAIVTIEGLASGDGTLHPMQQAFVDHDALQCGYCTPGQVVSAVAMLAEADRRWPSAATDPMRDFAGRVDLDEGEIRERMSGNLCRCAAYQNIVAAVREVAATTAADEV
ncbi:(2Fe-2S)-binding protein [Methylobacterium radiotolerans]|uniref:(2Fe-2S)-binding protein n=1 Tax=Methylobacterium TaxID=407 RepID=UPI0004AE29F6|nr:(2Fe-2S)-binding protein [Methylobacterium radiotolerans]PJI55774.1 (2Fe-2S)-binding protein [Methylobacterium radiotolerans]UIY45190.1 (2Fe-2S)-binding protein [Methylobacterium radiotolerans]